MGVGTLDGSRIRVGHGGGSTTGMCALNGGCSVIS